MLVPTRTYASLCLCTPLITYMHLDTSGNQYFVNTSSMSLVKYFKSKEVFISLLSIGPWPEIYFKDPMILGLIGIIEL